MAALRAIPDQVISVDVDPNAWPYRIQVGDETPIPAMPEKRLERREVKARASITCPRLGKGSWRLVVHDRNGSQLVGTLQII